MFSAQLATERQRLRLGPVMMHDESSHQAPEQDSDYDGAWKEALASTWRNSSRSTFPPNTPRSTGVTNRSGATRNSVRCWASRVSGTARWMCW